MLTLVSIMIPSFNSAKTLPLALASLRAQTHEDWEAVIVDDGSTDNTEEVVRLFSDGRIRYFKFEKNLGRGPARKFAMEKVRGDFLCMLDADDWFFPSKLQEQLSAFAGSPDLGLISSGMCIIDSTLSLVGVRRYLPADRAATRNALIRFPPLAAPCSTLPVPYGPCMMRMNLARQVSYDETLDRCQDYDYLLQFLPLAPFGIIASNSYVYWDTEDPGFAKVLSRMPVSRRILRKHFQRHPFAVLGAQSVSLAKEIIYRTARATGLGRRLLASKNTPPTAGECELFEDAKRRVLSYLPPSTAS
ncbi:MAG TPA: glycosyltransferase family 2 protein [Planctomycetota bacterium]|nr:glycosyltransferase family 2 protein [Planctomycetota bacterium]